ARSLRTLAAEGPSAMYTGSLGQAVADYLQSEGGLLDRRDLVEYRPSVGEALHSRYRDYELRTPGVGSGAGALIPMLNVLERFPLAEMEPLGAERMDLLAAVLGVIWPDRLAG